MFRLAIFFLLVGALLCPSAVVCAQPQPPDTPAKPASSSRPEIAKLTLVGFDGVDSDKALAVMETKPPHGFISFVPPPRFSPQTLERDVKRLVLFFHEHGFFRAKVDSKVVTSDDRHRVSVTITAQEGKPTIVKEVRFLFPSEDDRRRWEEPLRKAIPAMPSQRFNLIDYEEGKGKIAEVLSTQSHPLAEVVGQIQVRLHRLEAVILYEVRPGPALRFGVSRVVNNKRISSGHILRDTTYARGQPFDIAALRATERALLSTGFFNSVSIKPDYDARQGPDVPITIEVFESKPHSLRLSLGYGTADEYRIRVSMINRSILGWGETITIEGKYSHIYRGIAGRFELPHLFNRWSKLIIYGGQEQADEEAYVNRKMFLRPVFEYQLRRRWSWYLGYSVENNELVEIKTQVPDPEFQSQIKFISSIPVGVKYDSRDHPLSPTRGTYFRVELELSHSTLGSEVNFFRPVAEVRHILTLSGKWLLAGRAEAGYCKTLAGTDSVPLIRRFYPGGADSVRGYPYQRLGPLDENGRPLGGVAMLEGSVELRFPVWGDLGGVLFLDAGNTWGTLELPIPALRYAAGCGIRYDTPVGPLRLDFGYQLNPPPGDHLPRYQVFLTVGQAF